MISRMMLNIQNPRQYSGGSGPTLTAGTLTTFEAAAGETRPNAPDELSMSELRQQSSDLPGEGHTKWITDSGGGRRC